VLNEVLKDFIGAVELVLGALIANRGPVDKSLVINQICVDAATVSTRRITAETPKICFGYKMLVLIVCHHSTSWEQTCEIQLLQLIKGTGLL